MVLTELAAHDLAVSSDTIDCEHHHNSHNKKTKKSKKAKRLSKEQQLQTSSSSSASPSEGDATTQPDSATRKAQRDKLGEKKRKHISTGSQLKIKHTASQHSLTASQDGGHQLFSPAMTTTAAITTVLVVAPTDGDAFAEDRARDQDEDEEARRKKERRRSKREEALVSQETGRRARRATPPPTSPTITKLRKVHSLAAMAQSDCTSSSAAAAAEDATVRALLDESEGESDDHAEKRQPAAASVLKMMKTKKTKKTKKSNNKDRMQTSYDDDTTDDEQQQQQRTKKGKKERKAAQRLALAGGDVTQSDRMQVEPVRQPLGSPTTTRMRSTSAPDAPLVSPRGTNVLTPSSVRSGHSNNLISYNASSSSTASGVALSSTTARWTGGIKDWLTIRRMNKQRSVSDLDGSDHHGSGDEDYGSMFEVRREARTAMGLP